MNRPILPCSSRLKLRALQEKDAVRLFEYRNQPEVAIFQGWTPTNPKEVVDYANEMASRQEYAAGYWYQVVLERLTDNMVIGDVAFCIENEMQKQAELGIALDEKFQKQGFAQEAVNALIGFLFDTFDLHRIHISIDPANIASIKLFERVGFRHEGHLKSAVFFKGQWCDDLIMGLLKSEWVSVNDNQ